MGAGRPSIYTPELAEEICRALAESEGGLERLCNERDDFPCPDTAWRWKAAKPEFSEMVTRAKERQAEHLVYGGLKILQNCDYTEKWGSAAVNLAKGEADYRLKMVTKIAPRTMGDSSKVHIGGDPDAPPVATVSTKIDLSKLTDEERDSAMKLAHIFTQTGGDK